MIKFEFESHESTPEDQYIKEIVMFKFTADSESFYVPYFRKLAKDGGMFWSPASVGVTKAGQKKYYDGFMLDSRHREKQIREFLESRAWERQGQQIAQMAQPGTYYPHGMIKQQPVNDYSHGDGLAINSSSPISMDEVVSDQLPF